MPAYCDFAAMDDALPPSCVSRPVPSPDTKTMIKDG
jgi:hypothetical protein